MRMAGRRQSSNVVDQRGRGARMAGGLGLGGLVIVALIAYLTGGNPLEALLGAVTRNGGVNLGGQQQSGEYVPTAEEEELKQFASQVLAGTEDVWSEVFAGMGRQYRAPKMVLFTGAVQSGCGGATKQTGPFYCSADESVYLDLSFFSEMRSQLGADGDFAYAYVIAHEVGHHVQHLLGTLDQAHQKMRSVDKVTANQISVRLELQADFYAGLWAHHDDKLFSSLERGDIEEGMNCATAIGDDRLQKNARGYVQPETFTHGTSKARKDWFTKGYETGDVRAGDTFSVAYDRL